MNVLPTLLSLRVWVTSLGQLLRADLIQPVRCPSVHNQTQCTHMNYICMDRGQWDKSSDIDFKVIRGQGQGHGGVKVAKMAIFKVYLLRHLWSEVGFDYGIRIYGTISKFDRAGFLTSGFVWRSWRFRTKFTWALISNQRSEGQAVGHQWIEHMQLNLFVQEIPNFLRQNFSKH